MRYVAKFAVAVFTVAVSIKKTDGLAALETELIKLVSEAPETIFDDEEVIDFLWGYDSRTEAEAVVETLTPLFSKPEIVVVKIAGYDDEKSSIIFKDTR